MPKKEKQQGVGSIVHKKTTKEGPVFTFSVEQVQKFCCKVTLLGLI